MKKGFVLALTAWLLIAVSACGLAEGEGVVVKSSCNILQSGDYYLVYCFAQVHNSSEEIICMNWGEIELHNGDQLLSVTDVSQLWPYFLSPGEDGYLFDIVTFAPNEDGPVVPSVTAITYNIDYMTVNAEYSNYELSAVSHIEQDPLDGALSVVCEVTNSTQMDAYNPTVAFGLYTEGGALIYADGMSLQNVGIPSGETMLLRFPLEDVFVEQWSGAGYAPAQAQVIGAFRQDDD